MNAVAYEHEIKNCNCCKSLLFILFGMLMIWVAVVRQISFMPLPLLLRMMIIIKSLHLAVAKKKMKSLFLLNIFIIIISHIHFAFFRSLSALFLYPRHRVRRFIIASSFSHKPAWINGLCFWGVGLTDLVFEVFFNLKSLKC
jgi:hypothetical protein